MRRLRTRTHDDCVLICRLLVLMSVRVLVSSRFSGLTLPFAELEPIPVRRSYHLVRLNSRYFQYQLCFHTARGKASHTSTVKTVSSYRSEEHLHTAQQRKNIANSCSILQTVSEARNSKVSKAGPVLVCIAAFRCA